MENNLLVSVLMTARNAESYIGQSIESILNQSFADFEFLIIDDTSTDKTWEIIKFYQAKDSRIKASRNEIRHGISKNRNRLVSMASGRYIVWQDADDISLPERIKKQVAFMDSNNEVGICGGWLKFFNSKGILGIRKYSASDKILRKNIFRFSPLAQPASIIRKDALIKAGKYDEKLIAAEDLDMSFRIGQNYKFGNIQEIILLYRQAGDSITAKKLRRLELNTLNVRIKFINDKNYYFSISDFIYNVVQFSTLYLMPVKLRIALFNLLRNSKNER